MQGQVVGIPDEIAGEVPLAVVQVPDQDQIPTVRIHKLIVDSLGPACLPTAYLTLEAIGLTSFPLTTSGKVRKSELREKVLEYLSAQAISSVQQKPELVCASTTNGAAPTVSLLVGILAKLIGQPEQSIPREQPLTTVIDSINILRFQSNVEKSTGKAVSLEDLHGDHSVSELAVRMDVLPESKISNVETQTRQGPPTAADMVHTHGDKDCASRTQAVTEALLANHGLSWLDVENIFPVPDLSSRCFEAMRPLAFSMRMTTIYNSYSMILLRGALEKTLKPWSMFRSLAIKVNNKPLFVTVRPSEAMSQATVVILPEVESVDQLRNLRFPKADDNNVHFNNGGPLARFAITSIQNTNCAGLMMLVHHSIFDAISFQAFGQDLESNIANSKISEPYTDYKLFADTFYLHSSSIPAQNAVAYHVNRLRGASSLRETCWPPQRCPGWFIGDDAGYKIPTNPQNSLLQKRRQVDGAEGYVSVREIKKTANLDGLAELRSKHKISAPVLFKAACAMLNSRVSGAKEVMFANTQAGRQ